MMKLVEPDAAQQQQAQSVIHEFDEKQPDPKQPVENSLDASTLGNLQSAETQERRQLGEKQLHHKLLMYETSLSTKAGKSEAFGNLKLMKKLLAKGVDNE